MQLYELYINQTYLFMALIINQPLCRSNDKQNITRIEMSNQINYCHNNVNHIRLQCKNREICIICNNCMNLKTIRAFRLFTSIYFL